MLIDFYVTSIAGILLMSDETIENLLYPEDIMHYPLLSAFNLQIHTYIHIYMYINVSDNYLFMPNAANQ